MLLNLRISLVALLVAAFAVVAVSGELEEGNLRGARNLNAWKISKLLNHLGGGSKKKTIAALPPGKIKEKTPVKASKKKKKTGKKEKKTPDPPKKKTKKTPGPLKKKKKAKKALKLRKRYRGNGARTKYHADLGEFGHFWLTTSFDNSKMTWSAYLYNLDSLGVVDSTLEYELHQSWMGESETHATGAQCGAAATGYTYDPYRACGPTSAAMMEGKCTADPDYACAGAYSRRDYALCEAGALSSKYEPMKVDDYGNAWRKVEGDPLPVLDAHYSEGDKRGHNPPNRFVSVVFHTNGKPVLCGKLLLVRKGDNSPSIRSVADPTTPAADITTPTDNDRPVMVFSQRSADNAPHPGSDVEERRNVPPNEPRPKPDN